MKWRLPRLFLVTSDEVVGEARFLERATAALAEGGRLCALQLRAQRGTGGSLWDLARRLRAAAVETGASFWVNDRLDIGLVTRADGVQLGFRSVGPATARRLVGCACWIGCSVHGPGEASQAFEAGADLVVLGSIYPTVSHPDETSLGLEILREVAAAGRPIVAIGGITAERVSSVLEAGAWGVAVLSGVWRAEHPEVEVARYLRAIEDATPPGAADAGEMRRW